MLRVNVSVKDEGVRIGSSRNMLTWGYAVLTAWSGMCALEQGGC